MVHTGTGLRDRKRRETRARIEDAAVTLVLRDGLDATTVGAISELADISPRTFFNYFESKDAAILGLGQLELEEITTAEILRECAGADVVTVVVHLLVTVMAPSSSRPTIRDDRMEIIRRHPTVLAGQVERMTQLSGRLTGVLQQLVAGVPDARPLDESTAQVVIAACTGAIRAAIRESADAGRAPVTNELEDRATQLVRDMTERLR